MKNLWNMIGTVAIVNLFALLLTLGWLLGSGRLDRERWEDVRAILARPVGPREAPVEIPGEESGSVIPTSIRIDALDRQDRQTAIALRRLRDEKAQLDRALEEERRELERRESALETERASWETATSSERTARVQEQFRKSVRLLESVPPRQAKEMLLEMVRDGGVDRVVAYLDAMTPYKASSVLKAFRGEDETRVAADLLERLRRRTPSAGSAAGAASDAALDADASSPTTDLGAPQNRPVANSGASLDASGR